MDAAWGLIPCWKEQFEELLGIELVRFNSANTIESLTVNCITLNYIIPPSTTMAIVSLHRSPWTWQFVLFKLNDVGAKKTSKKRTAPDAILQKITCTKLRVKISENATIGRFLGLVYRLPSSIYSSPQGMTSTTEYILGGLLLHRQNFLEYGDILFMLQKFHDHHLRCILTKKHDMTKKSKPVFSSNIPNLTYLNWPQIPPDFRSSTHGVFVYPVGKSFIGEPSSEPFVRRWWWPGHSDPSLTLVEESDIPGQTVERYESNIHVPIGKS